MEKEEEEEEDWNKGGPGLGLGAGNEANQKNYGGWIAFWQTVWEEARKSFHTSALCFFLFIESTRRLVVFWSWHLKNQNTHKKTFVRHQPSSARSLSNQRFAHREELGDSADALPSSFKCSDTSHSYRSNTRAVRSTLPRLATLIHSK